MKKQTIYYNQVLVLNNPYMVQNNENITNDNSVIYVIKVKGKYFMLPGDATEATLGVEENSKGNCE